MVRVRYLRLANGSGAGCPWTARNTGRDVCLVDYANCPGSDTCWLFDIESDCMSNDGCIVDTN